MVIWPDNEEIQNLIEQTDEEEKKEESNVVPFARPATGGKDPPSGDWLYGLPVNSIFISRSHSSRLDKPELDEYKIVRKIGRTVVLMSMPYMHMQHGLYLYDTSVFSRLNRLVENLGVDEGQR